MILQMSEDEKVSTSHLNLTRPLYLKPLDQRHREGKRRDIAPYRDEPRPPSNKISFAGADPYENEAW